VPPDGTNNPFLNPRVPSDFLYITKETLSPFLRTPAYGRSEKEYDREIVECAPTLVNMLAPDVDGTGSCADPDIITRYIVKSGGELSSRHGGRGVNYMASVTWPEVVCCMTGRGGC